MNRRNVLLGLGTAAAGSGIVFGSGAFTQVQAERSVTIGIDSDSEALLALKANDQVASVYEASSGDNAGELVIDTSRLDDDNSAGFNVDSKAQIGQTTDSFGNEVDTESGNQAFKIVNNFNEENSGQGDATEATSGEFNGELDVAIDLTNFDSEDDPGELVFVATRSEGGSQTIRSGQRNVFADVAPDEEIYVAIRIITDNGSDPGELSGNVVFQAGSDLSADDFPSSDGFEQITLESGDEATFSGDLLEQVGSGGNDDFDVSDASTYRETFESGNPDGEAEVEVDDGFVVNLANESGKLLGNGDFQPIFTTEFAEEISDNRGESFDTVSLFWERESALDSVKGYDYGFPHRTGTWEQVLLNYKEDGERTNLDNVFQNDDKENIFGSEPNNLGAAFDRIEDIEEYDSGDSLVDSFTVRLRAGKELTITGITVGDAEIPLGEIEINRN